MAIIAQAYKRWHHYRPLFTLGYSQCDAASGMDTETIKEIYPELRILVWKRLHTFDSLARRW